MNASKASLAFQRKLLICWCIAQTPSTLSQLQKQTGMPRRTLQDSIRDLSDLGITCTFIQEVGARNNQGHYQITDWGPIRLDWIDQQINHLAEALGIKLTC